MTGFLCATPYHVLMAVNMTVCEGETADLFLLNHFPDAGRLVLALEQTKIFGRVRVIEENVLTLSGKLKRFYHALIPDKAVRSITDNFSYDRFVFFALDFLNASYIIEKSKGDCRFLYGEDGIGSYINDELYNPSAISRLLLKLTGREKQLHKIKEIYLTRPNYKIANKHLESVKMPELNFENTRFAEAIDALWHINADEFSGKRLIFFEEPIEEILGHNGVNLSNQIKGVIYQTMSVDKVFFKKHPRMFLKDESKCELPFECVMGRLKGERLVLVSVMCTACLNCLLTMPDGVSAVFLYKIAFGDEHSLSVGLDELIMLILKENNSKIFVPRDMEEFSLLIREIGDAE